MAIAGWIMGFTAATVLCLAYMVGLLATAIPWGGWIMLAAGGGMAIALRRFWRVGPKSQIWLIAGILGLAATLYFQMRLPQPQATDISKLLTDQDPSLKVIVTGQVTSLPRLTRSQKSQIWLHAQQIAPIGDGKPVTGKLYATVPTDAGSQLQPGQLVRVGGSLYLPDSAANPGGFDFKQYLQEEGSFAGLLGDQVEMLKPAAGWGWWQVQQRIVQSQLQGLGDPEGGLVSSMVLGGKAVDLSYQVKDAFMRVGLAHALAASGFQTSLILGVVLALTRRCSERVQFAIGTLALGSFVGLAGLQPAVLRAAIMGFGGLVALVMNRKVKPLGSLLVTATILLVINPLWIWNLGFQFSFLATLGLLVTVPTLTKRLDWLPSAIAPLITVPIAAYLWTLPLQLGAFGVLSPYSIPVNLITTPFISLISLGGMVSALAALIWSPAGSALAWLLKYPTQALLAIVHGFAQLPGNAYAVGTIPAITVIGLYGLLALLTFHPKWQRRWWLGAMTVLVLFATLLWSGANLTQVTILAAARDPVMVIRDRGRVTVINGGDAKTAQFTLLPFLQKVGINQINWAIAPDSKSAAAGWQALSQSLPVKSPTALPPNQQVRFGAVEATLIQNNPTIAQFTIQNQSWLWLNSLSAEEQTSLLQSGTLPQAQVLWWVGKTLNPELLQRIQPKVAIATAATLSPETIAQFQTAGIPLYYTGRDGAIQWTRAQGFQTTVDSSDNVSTAL